VGAAEDGVGKSMAVLLEGWLVGGAILRTANLGPEAAIFKGPLVVDAAETAGTADSAAVVVATSNPDEFGPVGNKLGPTGGGLNFPIVTSA
jgi:hypothetical protein